MFELIRTFVLSDTFLFILMMIALITVTRWAVYGLKAYRPYALGWMIGLLVIVIYSALQTPGEVIEAQPLAVQPLYFSDVMMALFLGLMTGAITIVGLRLGTNVRLRTALMVTGYTTALLLMAFTIFVSSPHVRRMMTIYLLSFGSVTLFVQVVWSRLPRFVDIDGDGEPDPELEEMFVAEGEVPLTRSQRILAVTRRILNAGHPDVERSEPVPGEAEAPPITPTLNPPTPVPVEPPVPTPVEPPLPNPSEPPLPPQPNPSPNPSPNPPNPPAPHPAPPSPNPMPQPPPINPPVNPPQQPDRPPNSPPPPPDFPPESRIVNHPNSVHRHDFKDRPPLPERVRSTYQGRLLPRASVNNAKIISLNAYPNRPGDDPTDDI